MTNFLTNALVMIVVAVTQVLLVLGAVLLIGQGVHGIGLLATIVMLAVLFKRLNHLVFGHDVLDFTKDYRNNPSIIKPQVKEEGI